MLSNTRQSSKPPHVTIHHRRRHRSLESHHNKPLKLDTQPNTTTHSQINSPNKISSLNDAKISFAVKITDHHSRSLKKLRKRSNISTHSPIVSRVHRQSQLLPKLNDVSTATTTNRKMNPSEVDSNLFDDRNIHTINASPSQTRSYHDRDQVSNWKKERKKQKNSCTCCRFCTPLHMILSLFAALLIAVAISSALVAALVKNKSSTTLIETTATSVTTSAATSTSPATTSTSSSTTTLLLCNSYRNQTWISSLGLLSKWTFDGSFIDEMNTHNATAMNSPSFITNGYVYQALVLNAASNQYLYTSYIPLINASFTIELWLYPTGFPNTRDHSILGLCTYPGNNQCLHLTIRKFSTTYSLYMSFYGDNCTGNASVPLNQWTHAAFTFDLVTYTMSIYHNGEFAGSCISALPLQGVANNVTIGYIPGIVATYGSNYFKGYIDQLTIVNRTKSALEILDDATLAAYYNFDSNSSLSDSGPNSLLSTSQSVSFVSSGHICDAIAFNGNTSYLQIGGLTGLGTVNKAFSISLWIRPYSLSGTLVFVSATAGNTVSWCIPFIGFATNGSIVAQIWGGSATRSVYGPTNLTFSVWHHIVETWSSTNGLRLYVDTLLVVSDTSATNYAASSASNYVKLGNRPNNACAPGGISAQTPAFGGDIDDVRVYSRELTTGDVDALYRY